MTKIKYCGVLLKWGWSRIETVTYLKTIKCLNFACKQTPTAVDLFCFSARSSAKFPVWAAGVSKEPSRAASDGGGGAGVPGLRRARSAALLCGAACAPLGVAAAPATAAARSRRSPWPAGGRGQALGGSSSGAARPAAGSWGLRKPLGVLSRRVAWSDSPRGVGLGSAACAGARWGGSSAGTMAMSGWAPRAAGS